MKGGQENIVSRGCEVIGFLLNEIDKCEEVAEQIVGKLGLFEEVLCCKKPVVGRDRLAVLHLLKRLIQICDNRDILQSKLITQTVALLVDFRWNSILHNVCLDIFSYIISSSTAELQSHLLFECKLLHHVCTLFDNADTEINGRVFRAGNIGHLLALGNILMSFQQIDPNINSMLSQCSYWGDFTDKLLEENRVQERELGGKPDCILDSEISEEDKDLTNTGDAEEFWMNHYWKIVPMGTFENY